MSVQVGACAGIPPPPSTHTWGGLHCGGAPRVNAGATTVNRVNAGSQWANKMCIPVPSGLGALVAFMHF